MQLTRTYLVLVLVLVACDGGGSASDGPPVPPIDAASAPDARVPDADPLAPDASIDPNAWVPLITASWTLQPGTEMYWCATRTMTENVYSHAMRPIAPPGTHHTVIAIDSPSQPDNPGFSCGAEFGAFWASGTGMQPLVLPDGVGLLAPAGMQLRLSLHLFNASDEVMTGTSGLETQRMNPADVVNTASVSYEGPVFFAIPSNNMPYVTTDSTPIGNRTIVAIFPHMHQLGTHFRARLLGGPASPTVLWDAPYDFNNQVFSATVPPSVATATAGQTLETQCTWRNNTGSTVYWGDSSTAEMCFTILMSY